MRNSVKVVIDAYDGTVDAYLADPDDPVVRTYARIFGGIFKPLASMPADSARIFAIRATCSACRRRSTRLSHGGSRRVLPPRGPVADPGVRARRTPNENPFMRHIIMRLPGETNPEFIYMTPFTPRGKDNLAAWMAARMDGANYGKLAVYRFPEAESRVRSEADRRTASTRTRSISQQITLWDQRGSQVIRGELLVIPIEESLIYVQPLYLRAEGGTHSGAQARGRRAREPRRDGGDARRGTDALFGAGAGATTQTGDRAFRILFSTLGVESGGGGRRRVAGCRRHPGRIRRGGVGELLRQAQSPITTGRSPRSAPGTGRSTGGRSSAWAVLRSLQRGTALAAFAPASVATISLTSRA